MYTVQVLLKKLVRLGCSDSTYMHAYVHHLCSHVTAPSTLSPLLQRVCMALSLHLSTV